MRAALMYVMYYKLLRLRTLRKSAGEVRSLLNVIYRLKVLT